MAYLPSAVVHPVVRHAGALWVPVALALSWLASQALWWSAAPGRPPSAWVWSAAMALLLLLWTLWQWRHAPRGRLVWSPAEDPSVDPWRWESAAYRQGVPLGALRCVFDAQHLMLLRAETRAGLGLWLWVARSTSPGTWGQLRQAVRATHRV